MGKGKARVSKEDLYYKSSKFELGDKVITDYSQFEGKLEKFDNIIYEINRFDRLWTPTLQKFIPQIFVIERYKTLSGEERVIPKCIPEEYLRLATDEDFLRIQLHKLGQ